MNMAGKLKGKGVCVEAAVSLWETGPEMCVFYN